MHENLSILILLSMDGSNEFLSFFFNYERLLNELFWKLINQIFCLCTWSRTNTRKNKQQIFFKKETKILNFTE